MISTKLSLKQAQTCPLLKKIFFQSMNSCHFEQNGGYFGCLKEISWVFLKVLYTYFWMFQPNFSFIIFFSRFQYQIGSNDCTIILLEQETAFIRFFSTFCEFQIVLVLRQRAHSKLCRFSESRNIITTLMQNFSLRFYLKW